MNAPTRPLVRYHGGKWILAPWIISHFPPHRIYVEPFGGGGSVLLRKPRCYAEVYNDLDVEIVNLFKVVRDRGDDLLRALELTPFSRDEYLAAWEQNSDPLEAARRSLIRSFMGFGSAAVTLTRKAGDAPAGRTAPTGFRNNSNRSGTTPAHDWRNYPEQAVAVIDRLRGVVIENRNYAVLIPQLDQPDALFYCDPPYPSSTRDKGSDYRHEMTDDEHRALARVLHDVRGMVVLSGYACELYDRDLFAGWQRVERPALADGARPRTEVLWLNAACSGALEKAKTQQRLIA